MSRLTRSVSVIVLGLCLVTSSARASQVVFGNLGASGSANLLVTNDPIGLNNFYLAQGFSTPASGLLNLSSITLGLSADTPFNATLSIYSDSGSGPSSAVSSATAFVSATPGLVAFNFGSLQLAAATTYWLVPQAGVRWYRTSAAQGGANTPTAYNSSGYSRPDPGTLESVTGLGGPWDESDAARASFSITATESGPEPIPEPGTWAAAALLIGAAAYVRWRRRPQAA